MANPVPSNLALSVINTNDPVSSAPLRNDFSAVQNAVNQLIACLSGGSAGQLLSAVDGTDVQWVNNITYRKTTTKTVVNTVTETDLLNGEITIAAGAMGTNGLTRITIGGDLFNNSGSQIGAPQFKLKFGSTTLFDTSTIASAMNNSSGHWGWKLVAEIMNQGAANAQSASFHLTLSGRWVDALTVDFAIGEGVYSTFTNMAIAEGLGSSVVNTALAQALQFTVTLPTANALVNTVLGYALVEIL